MRDCQATEVVSAGPRGADLMTDLVNGSLPTECTVKSTNLFLIAYIIMYIYIYAYTYTYRTINYIEHVCENIERYANIPLATYIDSLTTNLHA